MLRFSYSLRTDPELTLFSFFLFSSTMLQPAKRFTACSRPTWRCLNIGSAALWSPTSSRSGSNGPEPIALEKALSYGIRMWRRLIQHDPTLSFVDSRSRSRHVSNQDLRWRRSDRCRSYRPSPDCQKTAQKPIYSSEVDPHRC